VEIAVPGRESLVREGFEHLPALRVESAGTFEPGEERVRPSVDEACGRCGQDLGRSQESGLRHEHSDNEITFTILHGSLRRRRIARLRSLDLPRVTNPSPAGTG